MDTLHHLPESRRHHVDRGGGAMKGPGAKVRSWGFGRLFGLACFVTTSLTTAVAGGADSKGENLKIIIRVHDYARLRQSTLEHTESEVARIFREVEIETNWVDCPLTASELDQYPACQRPADSPRFDLSIVPRYMAIRASIPDTTLGFTSLTKEGERASVASLFYDNIKEEAQRNGGSLFRILAYAMAHELGHLLLRTSGHASTGIMRARWTPEDFRQIACGQLLFTPQQAEVIRSEIKVRVQYLAAAEAATVSSSWGAHTLLCMYATRSSADLQYRSALRSLSFRSEGRVPEGGN